MKIKTQKQLVKEIDKWVGNHTFVNSETSIAAVRSFGEHLQYFLEEADEEEEKVIDKIEKDCNDKVVDGLLTGIENRDKEIQALKQQLKEEKRLHQKCRDGLEGWNPPAKAEINRLLKENEGLVDKMEEQEQKIKELERRLESKKDRVKELEEELGKRNKELRAIKSALESDNPVKQLAKQKETTQFWGEEAMKLEQLLREKDQQPKVEEIMRDLREREVKYQPGDIPAYLFGDVKQILRKHL